MIVVDGADDGGGGGGRCCPDRPFVAFARVAAIEFIVEFRVFDCELVR